MDETQWRAILYGDSLILAGVQAGLSTVPNLEIITLEELPADWVAILHELHPSAVIFDLGSMRPDFPLRILLQSNLLLVGIDPETHRALVWSRRQELAAEARDLLDIIQDKKE